MPDRGTYGPSFRTGSRNAGLGYTDSGGEGDLFSIHLRSIPPLLWVCAVSIVAGACTRDSAVEEKIVLPAVSKAEIEATARKRVVLAHQSVGGNILDGVQSIAAKSSTAINIAETRQPPGSTSGIFHFAVGANEDPEGKLQDFEQTLSNGDFSDVDVAMVKLCYVDFNSETDAIALAHHYVTTVEALQRKFPQTRFVAITAPLTTVQTGPKAWIKRALGRVPYGFAENAKRQAFNELLRREFAAQSLFDLAKWETNASQSLEFRGTPLEALDVRLTSDGSHLNEQGRELVGAAFVKFVASTGSLR